jgi:aspartyl/asparaginyl beta-hydroxylase (cupin superfamily)
MTRSWGSKLFVAVAAVALALPFFIDGFTVGETLKDLFSHFITNDVPTFATNQTQWAAMLRANAGAIRDEFKAFEQIYGTIPRLADVSEEQAFLDTEPRQAWRTLFLRLYGLDSAHITAFPRLRTLLADVPGVHTVMISIIEGGHVGVRHRGIYKGVLRYLLGLEVRLL